MKKILIAVSLLASSVIAISNASAYSFTKTAKVKIVSPINLTPVTDLEFGTIELPTGTGTVIVGTDGVVSGSSTATSLGGTVTAGSYTVKGGGDTIKITISAGAAHSTGVTIGTFVAKYNGATFTSGTTSLADPTSPGKPLLIGATLTVDGTTASAGNQTADYDIAVVYE